MHNRNKYGDFHGLEPEHKNFKGLKKIKGGVSLKQWLLINITFCYSILLSLPLYGGIILGRIEIKRNLKG